LAIEVFLKLLGIGIATAILVDATIVRMVRVPAVMQLLGRANWWLPGWLDGTLPRIDAEPAPRPTGRRRGVTTTSDHSEAPSAACASVPDAGDSLVVDDWLLAAANDPRDESRARTGLLH
jgi:hypothetical protein